MKSVLVAGATGYLGRFLVQSFKNNGYHVRALVRNEQKLGKPGRFLEPAVDKLVDEVFIGDVTDPVSIQGACDGMDIVCSSVGLTRQKGKLTFYDVDYLGNLHLLKEAEKANVATFMYIHVAKDELMNNPVVDAKKAFVKELKASDLEHIIIKPTGYFSDITEVLQMAQKGKVYLVGKGDKRLNPIHGEDLANFSVESLSNQENTEFEVGGPQIYQHQEIGALAFDVLEKKPRFSYVPLWLAGMVPRMLKVVSKKYYSLAKFFIDAMTKDAEAPKYGTHDLRGYFQAYLENQKHR